MRCERRYIVCELVVVSHGKPCVMNVSDGDITHCLRTQVQRLHGDYGLALVHLSLRGNSSVIVTICSIISYLYVVIYDIVNNVFCVMNYVRGPADAETS